MSIEFRGLTASDLNRCDAARSFLQSGFWGSFKATFQWNARAFIVDWGEGGELPLLVLRRGLGPFSAFAYMPWGPELPHGFSSEGCKRREALVALAEALKSQLPTNTAFLRCDPPWIINEELDYLAPDFIHAGADIQAPDTVIVDLKPKEDDLLAGMKSKCRYNIRLAERKGVRIREADYKKELNIFYSLLEETAHRDGIAIHGKKYYERLFAHAEEYGAERLKLRLYIADKEEPLAALVALFRGEEATYLYGASSDRNRELMANYALQWRIMREAKGFGCERYDLFGIPPNDSSHPMAGLYRFKTGFGGKIIHRLGSWDYRYKPVESVLFNCAERLRKEYRTVKKAVKRNSFNKKTACTALSLIL